MSRTIAAALCETNQTRGLPQENVFVQNLYRLPSDYSMSFQRSTESTAPVQICAVASAQGDDTLGAMALQEVMKILSGMVAQAQTRSVLDFEIFVNQFLAASNSAVCGLSVSNNGSPIRVSMTMLIIEGSTMRIVSVGNTRAVLIRAGNAIALTNDHTVAHRYVQMGAILPDAENSHPESTVLTQYIGKFQQDGPVLPEKHIFMPLTDGDEICLLGTGITRGLSDINRNSVLVQAASPEQKANELVRRCMQGNIKGGLTVIVLKVESTLLMPAAAFRPGTVSSLAAAGAVTDAVNSSVSSVPVQRVQAAETTPERTENQNTSESARKRAKTIAVIRPIAVFLGCILVGYVSLFALFNVGNLMKSTSSPATDSNGSVAVLNKIMYVNADMVAFYSDPSLNNSPTLFLNRGDVVTLLEVSGSFSKVTTTDNVTGYIVSSMLSDSDPTIGESQQEMTADPTPIPSKEQTAVTTSGPKETKPSETSAATPTPTDTPAPATLTPTVSTTPTASPTPTDTLTITPSPTPATIVITETPTGTP